MNVCESCGNPADQIAVDTLMSRDGGVVVGHVYRYFCDEHMREPGGILTTIYSTKMIIGSENRRLELAKRTLSNEEKTKREKEKNYKIWAKRKLWSLDNPLTPKEQLRLPTT